MKWDFSLVPAQGSLPDIEAALHQHLNDRIRRHALLRRIPDRPDIDDCTR
jgi:hypothetical protein